MSNTGKRTPTKAGGAPPPTPTAPESSAVLTVEALERRTMAAYGGGVESSAIVPDLAVNLGAQSLPIVANPSAAPFVLLWNPACWSVEGRKVRRLVPRLMQQSLTPGLSGVARGQNGKPDVTQGAREHWQARGYRAIPFELGPGGSYIRCIDVDPAGDGRRSVKHYCTAWERHYSGVRSSPATTDYDGYLDWIEKLVNAGHIPGCQLPVAMRLFTDLVAQRDGASRRATQNGSKTDAERVKTIERDILIVEAYLESIAPTEPPPDAVEAESEITTLEGVA